MALSSAALDASMDTYSWSNGQTVKMVKMVKMDHLTKMVKWSNGQAAARSTAAGRADGGNGKQRRPLVKWSKEESGKWSNGKGGMVNGQTAEEMVNGQTAWRTDYRPAESSNGQSR